MRAFFWASARDAAAASVPNAFWKAARPWVPQLVAVADEEGAPELAGVGDPPQQVHGDERLAGAGRRVSSARLSPRASFSSTARIAASW